MGQQQTFRGFISILPMLILITAVVRFPHAGQADKITNQDFIKILEDSQAADVNIHQNPQTPTREVVLTLLDGQVKRPYVPDVKDARRLLGAHDTAYATMNVSQENYLMTITLSLMLSIVVVIIIVMVMNRSAGDGGTNVRMISFDRSRARTSQDSEANFSSVTGLVEEREELEGVVDFPKNPQKYTSMGTRILEDLLLTGPSGIGKALLAKAMTGEAGVPFFPISGSDFVEMFVGAGASRVRDSFEEAKKGSFCIVFINEIDAVACRRGTGIGGGHDGREQTLGQLLVGVDGFDANEGIIVMVIASRVDILDPAIPRPGRLDRKIAVGRPDVKRRKEIPKAYSRKKPLSEDVDLHRVARTTSGLTRADLENLMDEAVIISTRGNRRFTKQSDIDRALAEVGIGAEKKSKIISKKDKKITAYHETGHAILFHVLPDVGPVYTAPIIPTGIGVVDYTIPLSGKDEMFNTKGRTVQNIMVDLGGQITEEPILDDITAGASQDTKQATQTARAMVTQYGVSEKVGMIQYGGDESEVFIRRNLAHTKSYSNEVADTIDSGVKRVIGECYRKTEDIIKQHDYVLRTRATLLIEKERINQFKLETLLTPVQQHLDPVFRAGNDGKQRQEGEGGQKAPSLVYTARKWPGKYCIFVHTFFCSYAAIIDVILPVHYIVLVTSHKK